MCGRAPDYFMLNSFRALRGAAPVTLFLDDPPPSLILFPGHPPPLRGRLKTEEGIFRQKMGHNFPPFALQMRVG